MKRYHMELKMRLLFFFQQETGLHNSYIIIAVLDKWEGASEETEQNEEGRMRAVQTGKPFPRAIIAK